MIKESSKNVELTFDQLQQIDVVKKQLANLESEIVTATKVLKGTKLECDRVLKEKSYQEELLNEKDTRVNQLEQQKNDLIAEINTFATTLDDIKEQTKILNEEHYQKTTDLIAREKAITNSEAMLTKKVEDITQKANKLVEDQLAINTAKEAFSKASETVVW